jgi:Na+/H+ antiporter NhaC
MSEYGILSTLPPVLAIVIALATRNVIIALFVSVLSGVLLIAHGDPRAAVLLLFEKYLFIEMTRGYNAQTIVVMAIIGGFVAIVEKSGGAQAFAQSVTRFVNTRAKAQILLWFGGLAIFFTDSGNSLILGPTFKPMTDRLRISREKLSYILDSTSSPVIILLPFTGWGIYVMGIVATEFEKIGCAEHEFYAFLSAVPLQFYAWTTLLLVAVVALSGREFGPMAKAEHRALFEGKLLADEAVPMRPDIRVELPEGIKPKLSSIMVPLAVLFAVMCVMLVSFGFPRPIPGVQLRASMGTAYLLAAATCMALVIGNKAMTFTRSFDTYIGGMQRMMYMLVVLVLAWSVGSVCSDVGTSAYLISVTAPFLTAGLLPALMFVVGGAISFATGTSWGTFAILLPIAIPMAHALGSPMHASIAAVLSGGLFGDHCSPISDTTLLSSMAGASDHVDHVKTQIPYALTAATASLFGYLLTGWTTGWAALLLTLLALLVTFFGLARIWGERIPRATVEQIESGRMADMLVT